MDNDETQVLSMGDELPDGSAVVETIPHAATAPPGAGLPGWPNDFPDVPADFVTRRDQLSLREKKEKKKGKTKAKAKKGKGKSAKCKASPSPERKGRGKLQKLRRMASSRSSLASSATTLTWEASACDKQLVKSGTNAKPKPKAKGKAKAKAKATVKPKATGSKPSKPSPAPAPGKRGACGSSKVVADEPPAPAKRVRGKPIDYERPITSKADLKSSLQSIFNNCAGGHHLEPEGMYGDAPCRMCPYKHKGHFGVKVQKREGDGPLKWFQPYYLSAATPCEHACALQFLAKQIAT